MSKNVKPLQVSPIIKSSRYILFFSGILYGVIKVSAYTALEATARPKRHKLKLEKLELDRTQQIKRTRDDLVNLTKEMALTDLPPGWEEDIK